MAGAEHIGRVGERELFSDHDKFMIASNWLKPGVGPKLVKNEVQIWCASQMVEPALLSHLSSSLNAIEKSRAERFVFRRDRDRFVVARGILRELLADYAGCRPSEIQFEYGAQGKPALRAVDVKATGIHFNLSHSHELTTYAFALNRELGVDIELIRRDPDSEELAKHYFSDEEVAELHALPPAMREHAFFACWTRKEAYIKARGEGLQIPLASFSVPLALGSEQDLRANDSSRWGLRSFEPAPRYVGAVVVEGKNFRLRYWKW